MTSMHDSVRLKTTVYAAIELSKKSWVVGIAHPDRDRPSMHRIAGGNLADLIGRLRKAAGERRIVVCYEAGYDGFWLARSLLKIGIDCRVLDPASIQVNRRARRVKTDRIDSLALLRSLIAVDRGERHVCAVVRVPSVEEEDARRSHRERQRLVRERTGHINRIKGLLFAQGIRGIEPKRRRTGVDHRGRAPSSAATASGATARISAAGTCRSPNQDRRAGARYGRRPGPHRRQQAAPALRPARHRSSQCGNLVA